MGMDLQIQRCKNCQLISIKVLNPPMLNPIHRILHSFESQNKHFSLTLQKLGQICSKGFIDIADFYERVSGQFFNQILSLSRYTLNELNGERMIRREAQIYISEEILSTSLNIIQILYQQNGHQLKKEILEGLQKLQIDSIVYLQMMYPRGVQGYVPGELMSHFKNLDMTEQPQFDILKKMNVCFSSLDDESINETLKRMFNGIIDELEKSYPTFQRLVQEEILTEEQGSALNYKINRRIPETVSKFTDDNGRIEIESPELFSILYDWMSDIQDYLLSPGEEILEKQYYKCFEEGIDGKVNFSSVSPDEVQNLSLDLELSLLEHSGKYQQELEELKNYQRMFNANLIRILINSQVNQQYVPREQAQLIKFGTYNTNLLCWILIQRLHYVLKKLIKVSIDMENKIGFRVDLIKLNVKDFLRAQVSCGRKDMLRVFHNLLRLERENQIKIVRILNNLVTALKEVVVTFETRQSVLLSSITLVLTDSTQPLDLNDHNIEILSGFYEYLGKSSYGIIFQIAKILSFKDSKFAYERNITFKGNGEEVDIQRCRKHHPHELRSQKIQEKPFICSKCAKYYSLLENKFILQTCLSCNYFVCSACIISQDREKEKQYILDMIKETVAQEMNERESLQKSLMRSLDASLQRQAVKLDDEKLVEQLWKKIFNASKLHLIKHLAENHKRVSKKRIVEIIEAKTMEEADDEEQNKSKYHIYGEIRGAKVLLYLIESLNNKIIFSFDNLSKNKEKYIDVEPYNFIVINICSGKDTDSQALTSYPSHKLFMPFVGAKKEAEESANEIYRCYDLKLSQIVIHMPLKKQNSHHSNLQNNSFVYSSIEQYRNNLPDVKEVRAVYNMPNEGLLDSHLTHFQTNACKDTILFVNLCNNEITSVSTLLDNLTNLESLNIAQNNIHSISFVKKMWNLKNFIAYSCELSEINQLENIPNIRHINLRQNYLTSFQVVKMEQLTDLNLGDNVIQNFHHCTQDEYPNLTTLSIDFDCEQVDSVTFRLPKLKFLAFSMLSAGELKIQKSSQLTQLLIRDSQIENFECVFVEELAKVCLQQTSIINIADFLSQQFCKLVTFELLYSTRMDSLPRLQMPTIKELKCIDLHIGDIRQLENSKLDLLQVLNLQGNCTRELSGLKFPHLKKFTIGCRGLQNLDSICKWEVPLLEQLEIRNSQTHFELSPHINSLGLKVLKIEGGNLKGEYVCSMKHLVILQIQECTGHNFPLLELPSLQECAVSSSKFKDLSNLAKCAVPRLQSLELNRMALEESSLPYFEMPALESLQISDTPISGLRNFKGKTMNLKKLYIVESALKQLQEMHFPNLVELNLSYNQQLSSLDSLFKFELPSLKTICLSDNPQIVELPVMIGPNIQEINAARCGIRNLHKFSLSLLPNLTTLCLYNNPLSVLDRMSFPRLKAFEFDSQQLKILSDLRFCELKGLERLVIKQCVLDDPHFPVLSLPNLAKLEIAQTNIADVSALSRSQLGNLSKLKIIDNRITSLPVLDCPSLTIISANAQQVQDANYLKIVDIVEFGKSNLPKLTRLELEHNEIMKLPEMNFPLLDQLYLCSNRIEDLTEFMESCLPKLRLINIDQNPVNFIPFSKNIRPEEIYMKNLGVVQNFHVLEEASPSLFKLHYNQGTVPETIPKFNFLKANRIQFEECSLTDISAFFVNPYPVAEQISFVSNEIAVAPVVQCPKLKKLYFNKCNIKDADAFLNNSDLGSIEMLSLEFNQMKNLSNFPFVSVQTVFLSHGLIKDVSCLSRYEYKNLTMLVLFDLKITKAVKLNAPVLNSLYLNRNQITSIAQFCQSNVPALNLLQLSENLIQEIGALGQLTAPNLQRILLKSNRISTLSSLQNFAMLSELNLESNCITEVKEFVDRPNEKIYQLFYSLDPSLPNEEIVRIRQRVEKVYIYASYSEYHIPS